MIVCFSDCRLDLARRELSRGGQVWPLEPQAFTVLVYLVTHHTRAVAKDELLTARWPGEFVGEAALTRSVRLIRQAVGDDGTRQAVFKTLRGYGYRCVAAVETIDAVTRARPEDLAPETPAAASVEPDAPSADPATIVGLPSGPAELTGPVDVSPAPLVAMSEPPAAPAPPPPAWSVGAERRQLTVLSCAVVDVVALVTTLDPETLHDVLHTFHQTVEPIMTAWEGHVAQQSDQGFLAYFGWPQAHEDDAHRAIRAGLRLVDTCAQAGGAVAVRVGIHTGPVVVSAERAGPHATALAVGAASTVAVAVRDLATPNTVLISAATAHLTAGYFAWKPLGAHTLPGTEHPLEVYQVRTAGTLHTRLDVGAVHGLTPFIGREAECLLLQDRWRQVTEGHGHVVLISGEGGIGKSRVVQRLKDQVAAEGQTLLECHSSPYYQHTVLYPITDVFQRMLRVQADDTVEDKLETLVETLRQYRVSLAEAVPLLAGVFSLPVSAERYPPLNFTPERQRHKTLETLVALLLECAEHQPMLFILEDLHWTDPTTLLFLELLMTQAATAPLLVVLTCRPAFAPPWGLRSYLTPMVLTRFTRPQVEGMVARIPGGQALPADVVAQIVAKADGIPLFIEELTKAILASGALHETDGQYACTGSVASLAIPTTLQDALMARLDRLDTAKSVAQLGATIGRHFSYALL